MALKYEAVADNLDEAGDKLFTFPRFPESQWESIRTSNGIELLHEEFKRRIKTQTVLPSAETAAMLYWALLASGQITMTAPVAKTINTLLGAPSGLIHSDDSQIGRSSPSSHYESRNCRQRHASRSPPA